MILAPMLSLTFWGPLVSNAREVVITWECADSSLSALDDAIPPPFPAPLLVYRAGSWSYVYQTEPLEERHYWYHGAEPPLEDVSRVYLCVFTLTPDINGAVTVGKLHPGSRIYATGYDGVQVELGGGSFTSWLDFDLNGFVNADDFDAYVRAFFDGDQAADFNCDGFMTADDADLWLGLWHNGYLGSVPKEPATIPMTGASQ